MAKCIVHVNKFLNFESWYMTKSILTYLTIWNDEDTRAFEICMSLMLCSRIRGKPALPTEDESQASEIA